MFLYTAKHTVAEGETAAQKHQDGGDKTLYSDKIKSHSNSMMFKTETKHKLVCKRNKGAPKKNWREDDNVAKVELNPQKYRDCGLFFHCAKKFYV